jgi:hypothetical protein
MRPWTFCLGAIVVCGLSGLSAQQFGGPPRPRDDGRPIPAAPVVKPTDGHPWQAGIWRDISLLAGPPGSISIPIGTMTYSAPFADEQQYATIDGPDGLRYVARWRQRLTDAIVNDPMAFYLDGKWLYVKGAKPKQTHRMELLSTTRLAPVP